MDIIIAMLLIFSLLIIAINQGIFLGLPLLGGFFIFAFLAWKRGFSLKSILEMASTGGKKSFVVLEIFILIGAITGIWMASGTVPAIVYYGIKLVDPNYFILCSFLITSLVSFLLGTSFGTVSTVGLALIVIAKSGHVDLNITTGAIISGAYFGDRCSPLSSSATLVAQLTETNLYTNIRSMFWSTMLPFLLSLIVYVIFSWYQPLRALESSVADDILHAFSLNWLVLLPAIVIIIFSLAKVNVKYSMLVSILLAVGVSFSVQGSSTLTILHDVLFGFSLPPDNPLTAIIKGGGIISMWPAAFVVYISCALAGIFAGTNMLQSVEKFLLRAQTYPELFCGTTAVSILTGAFGCSQSISIVLTHQLMRNVYTKRKINNTTFALDLENTSIVLSALIPWNIAAFVPTTTMAVNHAGFVPYAVYLYLLPLSLIISLKIKELRLKISLPKYHKEETEL